MVGRSWSTYEGRQYIFELYNFYKTPTNLAFCNTFEFRIGRGWGRDRQIKAVGNRVYLKGAVDINVQHYIFYDPVVTPVWLHSVV